MTPAALNYLLMQAVKLDGDFMEKVNLAFSGLTGGSKQGPAAPKIPEGRYAENQALKNMGLTVRRA